MNINIIISWLTFGGFVLLDVTPSTFETPDGHAASPSTSLSKSRTGRDTELGITSHTADTNIYD